MTVKGGTSQACAACKYQRRKCAADCQFAPYFPADQPRQFQNAHRLFGVSNIRKILDRIDPSQHSEAMRSIIYEANIRDRYPVHGCLGIIYARCLQIQQVQLELDAVTAQLAIYRSRHQHNRLSSPPPPSSPTAASNQLLPTSQVQLSMHPEAAAARNDDDNNYALSLFLGTDCGGGYPGLDALGMGVNVKNENDGGRVPDHGMHQFWSLRSYHEGTNSSHPHGAMKSAFVSSAGVPTALPPHEYDEVSPYLDNIDDRQSYVDCKVHYESSSEESMKDTMQSMENVEQNDLKSAAACFSLTSVVN